MRHGHQIIEHLKGRRHNTNYENYLKENPEYLKSQRDVNKNLVDMLKKDEGKDVVLQENNGEAQRADDGDRTSDGKDEEPDFMTQLRKLALTTLRDLDAQDFDFLPSLEQLDDLELGDCTEWDTDLCEFK